MEDINFEDDSWKRNLDFDVDTTEDQRREKQFGVDARKLIAFFFSKMDSEWRLKFNPYRNRRQWNAAKKMIKNLGGLEATIAKATEMFENQKTDPHCPRILMPTQMEEKFYQYENYIKTRESFKKKKKFSVDKDKLKQLLENQKNDNMV